MEQYILKSTLVAEIKRLLSAFENSDAPVDRLRASILIGLLSFINTLEVKEVDLEKEMSEYFVEHPDEFFSDKYRLFAQHFFELGLKAAQKGEKVWKNQN